MNSRCTWFWQHNFGLLYQISHQFIFIMELKLLFWINKPDYFNFQMCTTIGGKINPVCKFFSFVPKARPKWPYGTQLCHMAVQRQAVGVNQVHLSVRRLYEMEANYLHSRKGNLNHANEIALSCAFTASLLRTAPSAPKCVRSMVCVGQWYVYGSSSGILSKNFVIQSIFLKFCLLLRLSLTLYSL